MDRDHKIARLEGLLVEAASMSYGKTSEYRDNQDFEDDRQDQGIKGERDWDQELERHAQESNGEGQEVATGSKAKQRSRRAMHDDDNALGGRDAFAEAHISLLERALIDIRDCILKTRGERMLKHPPKFSRCPPLDESCVIAYREEIIVEVMQRKNPTIELEKDLNLALSRREAAEAKMAAFFDANLERHSNGIEPV